MDAKDIRLHAKDIVKTEMLDRDFDFDDIYCYEDESRGVNIISLSTRIGGDKYGVELPIEDEDGDFNPAVFQREAERAADRTRRLLGDEGHMEPTTGQKLQANLSVDTEEAANNFVEAVEKACRAAADSVEIDKDAGSN